MLDRIQIFTLGCVRSRVTEKNLRRAIEEMGLDIEIEASADPKDHEKENLTEFPSVKINGELKVDGSFTTVEEFKELLSEYL
jgi:hypothetical protein